MARRMLALLTALLLVASLPLAVLADEWYLEDGNITVNANESGQTVSQGSKTDVRDDNPTITQRDNSKTTDNTITIKTENNATANVTIKDVNIETAGTGIEVGSSDATITVEGNSTVRSWYSPGIHVSSGDLTITGDGTLEVGTSGMSSTAIGSNSYEEMSGSISIKDAAKVTATATMGGAAIGSGGYGEMSGSITIEDNAQVTGTGDAGVGIGSGWRSEMSGSITIKDNATVESTGKNGAAIGSGQYGEVSGTIAIGGTANVTATSSKSGAGIGSGHKGEMSGTISISTGATVEASSIGAGSGGTMSGTIQSFDPDPAPTQPEPGKTPLYRVLNERGEPLSCTKETKDGVLTITVDADFAKLIGTVLSLKTLENQGVTSITLVTKSATSTFSLADLQAKGTGTYTLTHDGEAVTFTLAKADVSDILK